MGARPDQVQGCAAELWQRWLLLMGLAVAGVLLCKRLARQVSPMALRRVICSLLVVSGLCLLSQALTN